MGESWFRAAIITDEVLDKVAPVLLAVCLNEKEKKMHTAMKTIQGCL